MCLHVQWKGPLMSILIIYNSTWSILIQWIRVILSGDNLTLQIQKAYFLFVINQITRTKKNTESGDIKDLRNYALSNCFLDKHRIQVSVSKRNGCRDNNHTRANSIVCVSSNETDCKCSVYFP